MKGLIRVLDGAQMERVHGAGLELLATAGVKVENEGLLQRLEARGAKVDWPKQRAAIPRELAQELLGPEPGKGSLDWTIPPQEPGVGFGVGGVQPLYYDWRTGRRMRGTRALLTEVVRGAHGLPRCRSIGAPITMSDVPERVEPVEAVALLMSHTDRPSGIEVLHHENVKHMVALGEIFSGKPRDTRFVASCNFAVAPLIIGRRAAGCVVEKTRFGITGVGGTMPVSGATAPVTRAGTMAIEIAELVAFWALHRLLDPALPLGGIVCSGSLDMRTGRAFFGSPEAIVQDCGVVQTLQHFYGIRTHIAASYMDGKAPGIQTAFNKVFKALASGMFTHNFGMNYGLLDAGKVWSPVQMLLDLDMVDTIRALFRKLDVSDETLALDLTREVARGEHRTFIDSDHTAAHFRQHLFHAVLLDPLNWQGDAAEQGRDRELLERADQTWRDALRDSPRFELAAEKRRAVQDVLRRAREEQL